VEVVVAVVAMGLAAIGPSSPDASPLSLLAHLLVFLPHLRMLVHHSIYHLLHYPHLGCNCWISTGWWRIWRVHICLLLLWLSKYPPTVSIGV
jgi:hypothetical protein